MYQALHFEVFLDFLVVVIKLITVLALIFVSKNTQTLKGRVSEDLKRTQ